MRVRSLADLDRRLVPPLARLARQVADAAVRRFPPVPPPVPGSPPLVGLDHRFTRGGPLRVLRERPQLGLLVVGAILALAVATAAVRR